MNLQVRHILFHVALATATVISVCAIGWVVVDSWVMPHVARSGWPVVVVPDISGLSTEQASRKLVDLGLEPTIDPERRRADRIGPDLVALQRPAAGDSVKKGHVVRVWLSAGATTVPVPDLQGQDSTEALTHVQEAGLQISGMDYVTSARVDAGQHPIEDRRDREHIRRRIQMRVVGEVLARPERRRTSHIKEALARRLVAFGQAEIRDFWQPSAVRRARQENVFRLQIAVDNPHCMRVGQSRQRAKHNRSGFR